MPVGTEDSLMEFVGTGLTLLGGSLLACVKLLTKHWSIRQDKQQAHEKALHEAHQKHEQELADKFSDIANNFKEYASSEREDRKKLMDVTLDIHAKTLTAVGEMKSSLESMRVALDQNTRRIDEFNKEKR